MQKEDMPLEGFGGWVRARARGKVGAVSEEAKIGVFRIRRVWVSWFSGVFFGGGGGSARFARLYVELN